MELVTLIFSGVGAIAAAAATYIGWLVYAKQTSADLPGISIEITPHKTPDWYVVRVEAVNRSDVSWKADLAEVTSPAGAKLISQFDVRRDDDGAGNGEPVVWLIDPTKISRSAKPRMKLAPAGSRGNALVIGSADRHWEELFLFVPSAASRIVSIRYSLRSTEAVQRRTAIAIKRTLSAHPATVTD